MAMKRKVIEAMGVISLIGMITGTVGTAGAVETDNSPVLALVIAFISALILGGVIFYEKQHEDDSEGYTELYREPVNRPYFLH